MRAWQWCQGIAEVTYDSVYLDQEGFEQYQPTSYKRLINASRE